MAQPATSGWQAQILRGIGAPVTPQNLLFVNDWAKAEGGGASNNPFNTTQPASGASSYNSVGVRNYGSPDQGIKATVQTLENGRYGSILAALRQGTSARSAASALAASPWGTGSLVEKMLGGGDTVPSGSPGSPARAPMSVGAPVPSPGAPTGTNPLGQILSQTNQMVGLGSSPALASLFNGEVHGAPPIGRTGGVTGTQPVPAGQHLTGIDGVRVDAKIAPDVAHVVRQFGVSPTSGYRDAAHNASVGGASNSDHLRGDAVDFGGPPAALSALYKYAQGRFPYVEPMAQARDHVHISFSRPGK